MTVGNGTSILNQGEGCKGCDYFGDHAYAVLSPVTRELTPDEGFLRTFPLFNGSSSLPFSVLLDSLECSQDDRQMIETACDEVCTAPEGMTFSTAPIIVLSGSGTGRGISSIYLMAFHARAAEMPSLCLVKMPASEVIDSSARPEYDWSCLDTMNDAVIIAGSDARVQWANRVAIRDLSDAGMKQGVGLSAFWKRFLWGDDGHCPFRELIPMCGMKTPRDIFVEDALGRFWRIRAGLLGDAGESPYAGYIITAVEMTEWVARRERFSAMQNTLSAFMEHPPSSVVIVDLDGKIHYLNARMKEFFHKMGCHNENCFAFPPEVIRDINSMIPEVLEKGFLTVEQRHCEPEKRDQIYQLTLFSIPHPGHRPFIGCIAFDLTEERRHEKERVALVATLFEAQKAARVGNWDYADETGITFRGICHETLSIRNQSVSVPLEQFLSSIAPDDAPLVRDAVMHNEAGGLWNELHVSIRMKDGTVKYVAFRARSRTDGIEGTVGTIQDITEMVKAEKARSESIERFRLFFNSNMSGSMIIEPLFGGDGDFIDFRYIAVNESFSAMNADSVFSESTEKLVPLFYDTVMQGGSGTGEWTYSQNGKVFSGQIFRLGESQPYYGCSFIDVSAEREALRVLQENDEFLNIIFPNTIEGIIVVDAVTHTIQDLNATACELIGSEREELIGRPCCGIICPAKDGICPVTDLGEEVNVAEQILLTADGGRIPVLKSVKQVVYRGRNCLIEMIIDLRDVKAAEQALSISEERYRMVFETSPDGILITDTSRIDEVNPAFAKALGYLPEEMKGHSILDFAPELQGDGVPSSERRSLLLANILDGREISTPWEALSRNGQVVRFEVQGSHVNLLGNSMVILVGRDVTEMIQLKQRQGQALDQIEENLTSLAILNDHIRNPLMVISAYSEMRGGDYLPIIMDQIKEIDGIINTLDQGFLESEKIREFLRKHHNVDGIHHDFV